MGWIFQKKFTSGPARIQEPSYGKKNSIPIAIEIASRSLSTRNVRDLHIERHCFASFQPAFIKPERLTLKPVLDDRLNVTHHRIGTIISMVESIGRIDSFFVFERKEYSGLYKSFDLGARGFYFTIYNAGVDCDNARVLYFGPISSRILLLYWRRKMKIDLSKEEYQTLVELLEIASWVLHAHKTEQRPETQKYREFEQKIYSYAEELDLSNLIVYHEELKQYFSTREFEEDSPVMGFVEEFENASFWDELVNRMAIRDLVRAVGEKKAQRMTMEERFLKMVPLEDKYWTEFVANGLDNLTVQSVPE